MKALRDRCYHNPATGILRDSCEVDMDELAAEVGIGRSTLFNEFKSNAALGQFVKRIERYQMRDGRPHRTNNVFQVCMDDPIHPSDLPRYDDLRALKEQERDQPLPTKIILPEEPKPSSAASSAYESRIRTHSKSAPIPISPDSGLIGNAGGSMSPESGLIDASMSPESGQHIDYLPPGILTKEESLTPAAGEPPHISPQGERPETNHNPDPLQEAWLEALPLLQANEAITHPCYQTHIARLQPVAVADLPDGGGVEVVLATPSEFTRTWLEKRHQADLDAAWTAALGCSATVRLTGGVPPPTTHLMK